MIDRIRALPMAVATLTLAIILVITAPISIRAEYYRYIDKTGAVRFTDNLLDVPETQRSGVKKITAGESSTDDAIPAVESSEGEVEIESEQMTEDDSKKLEYEYLKQQKEVLDKEYAALIKEKDELIQSKEKMDIIDYNQQVQRFNKRISAYEERRKAFELAVNAFNAQLNQ